MQDQVESKIIELVKGLTSQWNHNYDESWTQLNRLMVENRIPIIATSIGYAYMIVNDGSMVKGLFYGQLTKGMFVVDVESDSTAQIDNIESPQEEEVKKPKQNRTTPVKKSKDKVEKWQSIEYMKLVARQVRDSVVGVEGHAQVIPQYCNYSDTKAWYRVNFRVHRPVGVVNTYRIKSSVVAVFNIEGESPVLESIVKHNAYDIDTKSTKG